VQTSAQSLFGVRWERDPAELLDDAGVAQILALDITDAGFESDELGWWIYRTLLDRPMGYEVLLRWVRRERPRLLPDTVGRVVKILAGQKKIACDERRRWYAKPLHLVGIRLTRNAA
jgi:hypothetical protein